MIKLPAGVLRPIPSNSEQAIQVLLAEGHRPLLGLKGLHGGGKLLFLRKVFVVQSDEGDIVRADVEEHELILQEGVLREFVRQVEEEPQEVQSRHGQLEVKWAHPIAKDILGIRFLSCRILNEKICCCGGPGRRHTRESSSSCRIKSISA